MRHSIELNESNFDGARDKKVCGLWRNVELLRIPRKFINFRSIEEHSSEFDLMNAATFIGKRLMMCCGFLITFDAVVASRNSKRF